MTGATEVRLVTSPVAATIGQSGITVMLTQGRVTTALAGLAGPQGPKGDAGPDGAPGAGLAPGGAPGRIPVKQGLADFETGWSAHFTIDPASGWAGAGTDDPEGPLHDRGSGRALLLENANADGKRWTLCPGHPGAYDESLIFAFADDIADASKHALRLQAGQPMSLPNGCLVADGTMFGSQSSAALAFYQPFTGSGSRISFRGGLNSGTAHLAIEGVHHDGAFHGARVMTLYHSADDGQQVAIGDVTPTATLHVDGPIRCAATAKANIPPAVASGAGATIYVTDAAGGARPFWSDGADWRDAAGTLLA